MLCGQHSAFVDVSGSYCDAQVIRELSLTELKFRADAKKTLLAVHVSRFSVNSDETNGVALGIHE